MKPFHLKRKSHCVVQLLMLTSALCSFTKASEKDDPLPPAPPTFSQGNLQNVTAGGAINQKFHRNEGGKGGDNHIIIGSPSSPLPKSANDYFNEGKRYLNNTPPDYRNAETYFLIAANESEKNIKLHSYVHLAECKYKTQDYSGAIGFYENAIEIGHSDQAYKGLMRVWHELGTKAKRLEKQRENFNKVKYYYEKIKVQTDSDDEMVEEISGLSLSHQEKTTLSSEKSPLDDGEISVLSGESSGFGKGKDVEALLEAVRIGNEEALEELQQMSDTGNIDALLALIQIYKSDDVGDPDFSKVYDLASKAAKKGNKEAQFELAECYYYGKGVTQDEKQAQKYYKFASKQGHEGATQALNGAKQTAEQERLKQIEAENVRKAEEARQKLKAEQERLRQIEAENARKAEEARQKVKAEQEALEKQRAEQERLRQIEAENARKAEEARQKVKAEQEALEKQRAEQERLRQIEAENVRKAEEARQKVKAEQEALEKQRAELAEQRRVLEEQQRQVVARPVATSVPDFARGHEEIYHRFINGKLIFDNEEGQRKEFPFRQFADTCEGEFDLSGLQYRYDGKLYNVNDYLSINLGFRRGKNPAHANKVEVWILPKFLMGMHIDGAANHYKSQIWDKWTSEVGILWTYGNWSSNDGDCDYLVNKSMENLHHECLSFECGLVEDSVPESYMFIDCDPPPKHVRSNMGDAFVVVF